MLTLSLATKCYKYQHKCLEEPKVIKRLKIFSENIIDSFIENLETIDFSPSQKEPSPIETPIIQCNNLETSNVSEINELAKKLNSAIFPGLQGGPGFQQTILDECAVGSGP